MTTRWPNRPASTGCGTTVVSGVVDPRHSGGEARIVAGVVRSRRPPALISDERRRDQKGSSPRPRRVAASCCWWPRSSPA